MKFPAIIIETPHYSRQTVYIVRDSAELHRCLPARGTHDILDAADVASLHAEDPTAWADLNERAKALTGDQVLYRVSESREYEVAADADAAAIDILGHDLSSLQVITESDDVPGIAEDEARDLGWLPDDDDDDDDDGDGDA